MNQAQQIEPSAVEDELLQFIVDHLIELIKSNSKA